MRRFRKRPDPNDRGPVGVYAASSTAATITSPIVAKAVPLTNSDTPRTEATTTATSHEDSSMDRQDETNDNADDEQDDEDNSTLSNNDEHRKDNESTQSDSKQSETKSTPSSSDPSTSDSPSTTSTNDNETSSSSSSTTTATTHPDREITTKNTLASNAIHNNLSKLREKLFRLQNPIAQNNPETTNEVDINGTSDKLLPMPDILVSPYEGNRSAETGEEPLEQWKKLLQPLPQDDSNQPTNNTMNPVLSKLYGEPLAKTIFRAKAEIATLQPLFETSWKWGEIGNLQLGWIPKRQLLLCLCEEKIANPGASHQDDTSDSQSQTESSEEFTSEEDDSEEDVDDETEALKTVTRKLECFDIVMAAMREWKLKFDFPELYSNKDGGEFVFAPNTDNETKQNCYKCLIFVARVFATLLLFQQEQSVSPSLFRKVRACLKILNSCVKAHPSDLAKILHKKKRRERDVLRQQEQAQKKRRLEGGYDDRELTLRASFALVQRESETLLKMMDYYKTRLLLKKESSARRRNHESDDDDSSSEEHSCPPMDVSHLETMNEEIVANARRDFAREERFQKKLLLARQKRTN